MENNNTPKVKKIVYIGKTHTIGGREGSSKSSDGILDIQLSSPGTNGGGTNPEQLFAAGWSACFIGAMRLASAELKVKLPAETSVDAEVDLCFSEGQYFLQARLRVSLPGLDTQTAQSITDGAHQRCPYSKAIKGNIDVVITIV